MKGGAAGRFSPSSWCFLPDRRTDPRPDGRRWAAAAPRSRCSPAGWTAHRASGASAAASGSDTAAPAQSALTRRRWSRGTRRGCRRSACPPYTAEPRGPPLRARWMETHSLQVHLKIEKREWQQLTRCHDCRARLKRKLTRDVEKDDPWVLSDFVGSRASVEGVDLCLLDLQRAHDFLGKCVCFVNNCTWNTDRKQHSLFGWWDSNVGGQKEDGVQSRLIIYLLCVIRGNHNLLHRVVTGTVADISPTCTLPQQCFRLCQLGPGGHKKTEIWYLLKGYAFLFFSFPSVLFWRMFKVLES